MTALSQQLKMKHNLTAFSNSVEHNDFIIALELLYNIAFENLILLFALLHSWLPFYKFTSLIDEKKTHSEEDSLNELQLENCP